jgi:hypothetical protein
LQRLGKLDVEEEFQQACFHITVYKSYVPAKPVSTTAHAKTARAEPAESHRAAHSATGHPETGQEKRVQPKTMPNDAGAADGTRALGQ